MSNGSEDIRSFETGTKNCCEKIAEIEQDNDLQSLSEGLGNIQVNSSVILGDGSNGEFREVLDIYDRSSTDVKSRGYEAIADYISKTVVKEGQEMQKPSESVAEESSLAVEKEGQEILISDHSSEVTHPTLGKLDSAAHCSGRKTIGSKNSCLRELESEEKENSGKPWEIIELNVECFENGSVAPCTVEGSIDLEKCKMVEGEIVDIEKSFKSLGTTHPTTGQLETSAYFEERLENRIDAPCTRKEAIESGKFKMEEVEFGNTKMSDESLDTTHPNAWQLETGAYCEETIGTLKCNREEKNVDETENSDKLFEGVHSAIKHLENDTFLSIDEGTMGTENSKRVEKEVKIRKTLDLCSKIIDLSVKEFTNSINENFSCKETIGDNSERAENRVECRENSDKCCDAVNSTIKKLSSSDLENSEQYPPHDLQTIEFPPKKRQKMDFNEVMMNLLKKKCQNKNTEVPIRVYQRLKRKIPLKSGLSTSVTNAGINVEAADNPKSLSGESIEENVTENSMNGSIQSNLLGPAVEECAVVSVLAKRDAALTQTALSVLFSKRAKLCHQQHMLQDEVAVCDANIEKIIEGKEDALALKLDAIIDGCTNMIQREGPTALSMQ